MYQSMLWKKQANPAGNKKQMREYSTESAAHELQRIRPHDWRTRTWHQWSVI